MGKLLLLEVDLIVLLVYKFGALIGVGVLLVCDFVMLCFLGG